MAKQQSTATQILRTSIYTFLQQFQFFTSTPAFLAFPFSASVLLSQAAAPAAATAAGFPPSSQFFTILNLKLAQTIAASIYTIPFSLTFFLFAKSSAFASLKNRAFNQPDHSSPPESVSSIFWPLLLTHITNSFLVISANASAFCVMFLSFNVFERVFPTSPVFLLLLSAVGALVYSVICNLAAVISAMEKRGGYLAVLKAAVMMQGRASTALSLALPVNLGMAGIEALFQYRIVIGRYWVYETTPWSRSLTVGLEAMLICYMYSMFVVLDAIVGCFFFKSIRDEIVEKKCGLVGEELEMGIGYYASWKVDGDDDDKREVP
ncbi:unnamed protein product [Linum tenue]|uniref:Uncharacterized protein n=1 Tax=Linum tenue TaxID=586396 RepID=A0AAV0JSM4_9ROSI|nr:unnamed protein product [Linum tenue]